MQRVSSVCISNHLSVTAFEQRIFDPCAETLSHSHNVNQAVSGACMTSKDNVLLIPEVQYCVFPCIQGLAWSVRAFSILRQLERGHVNLLCVVQRQTDSWMLSYTYIELRPCIQSCMDITANGVKLHLINWWNGACGKAYRWSYHQAGSSTAPLSGFLSHTSLLFLPHLFHSLSLSCSLSSSFPWPFLTLTRFYFFHSFSFQYML